MIDHNISDKHSIIILKEYISAIANLRSWKNVTAGYIYKIYISETCSNYTKNIFVHFNNRIKEKSGGKENYIILIHKIIFYITLFCL